MKNYLLLEIKKNTREGAKYSALVVSVGYGANIVKVFNNWQPVTMTIYASKKQAEQAQQIKEEIYKKLGVSFIEFSASVGAL